MLPEIGDRIELVAPMKDDPCPVPVGSQGTVNFVGPDLGRFRQIGVKWDSGRSLLLVVPPDEFRIIPKGEP